MPNTPPNLIAGGNILPHRFVTLSTTADNQGVQSGTNALIIGASGPATKTAPLSDLVTTHYAAESGDSFRLLGDGELTLIEAGATVTAGINLKSDSQGRGVASLLVGSALQNVGAITLQSGIIGDLIQVQIKTQTIYAP